MGNIAKKLIDERDARISFVNKMDVIATPIWDLTRYTSLMLGIAEFIREDPSILRLSCAGLAYALGGLGKKSLEKPRIYHL